MIAIIKWELSRRKLYIFFWSLIVVGLITLLMLVYPSIHQQAAQLDAVFRQLPASLKGLRGGDADLASPVGYLNAELFYITLPLLLIILSVGLGGALLGKDEQDHTLELLLARPVSRGLILLAKAISGLLIVLFVGLLASATIVVLAKLVSMDIATRYILLTGLCTTIFSASFGAVMYALTAASVVSRRIGTGVAVALSFGGYLLESLSSMSDFIRHIATVLPYHFFVPKLILTGTVSRGYVLYMAGIFSVSALLSYIGFRRRDIG